MKIQSTDSKSSTSAWQLLNQIDTILSQSLPLAKRLEEVNDILIESLNADAIWCLTIDPLPLTACGIMHTPLSIAPDAKIYLVDNAPPIEDNWPVPGTLLEQVTTTKIPLFFQPNKATNDQTDSDLGDVLFGTFNASPTAIVPLVADDTCLGAFVIGNQDQTEVPLSDEDQSLLIYLSKYLAKNLQHAYLAARSERHANVLMTLNQIANTITSSLDIDEVIQRTMAGINAILNVEAGSLLLLDEDKDELYFKITLRGENKQVTSYRLKRGEGIAGWVVANNKPVISSNPATDKRFAPKIDQAVGFTTRAVLCVPLLILGKPIGALEVLNKRSGPFNEDDQDLLVSMAASLGIALKNAHLYEDAQERARLNEVVNQITAAINTGHGLTETAKIIFSQFNRLFTSDHIDISLLDDSKEKIRQWVFDEHGCTEQTKQPIFTKDSRLAQIIETGQGYIQDDISKPKSEEKVYPDDQILLADRIKSTVTVLLTTQQKPYGCLTLGSQQAKAYGPWEIKLLEQLTPQVAVTIEKALLIDTMEHRTTELQLLNRLGEMLASTLDIDLIVDTTLNMLPRLLPGDVQGIVVSEEERVYAGAAVPSGLNGTAKIIQDMLNTFTEMNEGDISTELISSRSVVSNRSVPADWKPVTVLSFPILTRRGVQGVIYMASGQEENLSDNWLRIFSLIVSQISAAVENAHLFQQVEQERARLAAILASSTDAVLVVNRNGRIVLDNPAAWEVIGAKESQSGRLLSESTNVETLVNLFESAMQGGTPTGEILLDDGRTFFANLSPVSAGEASIIGWVATMQDVSHFKELNELKNEFVSSVSHDLRSPLSTILMATSLISEAGEINDIQQDMLAMIEKRIRGMSQLIEDLLDVSSIEAGIDMEMEPCNIAPIIEEATTALMPQTNDQTIQLTTILEQDLPAVTGDATRLRQIIYNLVGNAIKYTPNEGQVTVKAYSQDDEIRLQVIDTGLGIPASDQPHIFERFYRVRDDHVANIKGTGLGLAIVRSIVERHNGRIWLESVPGEGSTFTVALPIYNEATS